MKKFLFYFLQLLAVAGSITLCASAQEPGEGILAAIHPQLKDPSKPFTMVVRLKAKEGSAAGFEAAFAAALKATRKEKGCLAYDLNRLVNSKDEYVVYEKWASYDAIKNHVASPYIVKLLGQLPEFLEGGPKIEILIPAGE